MVNKITMDSNLNSTNPDKTERKHLVERINTLENTVNQLTEQQGTLTHKLREQSKSFTQISKNLDDLKEEFETLKHENVIRDSKINNIRKSIDIIEDSIADREAEVNDEQDTLQKRLSIIENMLEIDEVDIAQAVKPNACELEQLTTIPEESRKESFDVRVQRAIAVYENFTHISQPVKGGGRRVLSKDIKTFLNGYSKSEIAYSQVQRVIDSFDEKTNGEYMTIQTDEGRAIIWKPDK